MCQPGAAQRRRARVPSWTQHGPEKRRKEGKEKSNGSVRGRKNAVWDGQKKGKKGQKNSNDASRRKDRKSVV